MKQLRIVFLAALAVVLTAMLPTAFAETLSLPAGLTAIEDQAFFGNEALDTVVLPEGSGPSAAKPLQRAA